MNRKKIEILAPAGSLEKMNAAIQYGADAVYMGSESLSLRSQNASFSIEQLGQAIDHAHVNQIKVYLAVNILARQSDFKSLRQHFQLLREARPDALIIADPGIFALARQLCPDIPIHISTQASVTNAEACRFWYEQGASRIILARELSLAEIREIRQDAPADLDLEVFVHGAMCIAWSGRCLLSNVLTGRDANRGQCAQPCRWSYQLREKDHPDNPFELAEDKQGSYILSSRDLCMIEHIPELAEAGISSFKIEGRTKSSFYVATVVKAYREALKAWQLDPTGYKFNPAWLEDLDKTVHRPFATGFYFDHPMEEAQVKKDSGYLHVADVVGIVKTWLPQRQLALVEQRNRVCLGDQLECVMPLGRHLNVQADALYDLEFQPIKSTPHPKMLYYLPVSQPVPEGSFFRRLGNKDE